MSGWTHRVCTACWNQRNPDRLAIELIGVDEGVCCACGGPGGGIFIRAAPGSLKCENKGPEHEDSEP